MSTFHRIEPHFSSFALPAVSKFAVQWEKLLHTHGCRFNCSAGELITIQKRYQFDLFYVAQGSVQVVFDTLEGRVRSVVSFGEGSLFNLAPAATRKDASGQYQCIQNAVIWRLAGSLLHDPIFVAEYPELMMAAVHQLGHIVLTYHTFLTDMQLDDFLVRFCRFLLALYDKHGSLSFACGMTQDHIAAAMGVHRATLGRAVQNLKNAGIIKTFTSRHVVILDIEALRSKALL